MLQSSPKQHFSQAQRDRAVNEFYLVVGGNLATIAMWAFALYVMVENRWH